VKKNSLILARTSRNQKEEGFQKDATRNIEYRNNTGVYLIGACKIIFRLTQSVNSSKNFFLKRVKKNFFGQQKAAARC